jgi:hypothetical protein
VPQTQKATQLSGTERCRELRGKRGHAPEVLYQVVTYTEFIPRMSKGHVSDHPTKPNTQGLCVGPVIPHGAILGESRVHRLGWAGEPNSE